MIAIATCSAFPDGDDDAPALREALDRAGIRSTWCVWDDPSVDWPAYSAVILRSTWDYTAHLDDFLAWTSALPVVHNPVDVIAWNTDKRYLRELADAGIPIIPTTWAEPGERPDFPTTEFVIKPSVGAGSRGAGRFEPQMRAAAEAHLAALHEVGRTVMVQPYLSDVDAAGETALIYFDGTFSHAIRKSAMLPERTAYALAGGATPLYEAERISARTPSDAELAIGEQALAVIRERFGGALLYTRVDLLPGPDGPVVIELELTEPSLFLTFHPASADALAAAIVDRLGDG